MQRQTNNNSGKSLSRAGLSSVTINNTIYVYGGRPSQNNTNVWSIKTEDILNNSPATPLTIKLNNSISGSNIPNLQYAPGAALNNDTMIIFSGDVSTNISIQASNTTVDDHLSIYLFDLKSDSNAWSTVSSTLNGSIPSIRRDYSVSITLDKQKVYLFGGTTENRNNSASSTAIAPTVQNDFWVFYTNSFLWKRLASPYNNNSTRCGHTASMLSDGRIVIIGGYKCNSQLSPSKANNTNVFILSTTINFIQMDQLLVYDSKSSNWIDPPQIKGTIPPPRTYHSATVMKGNNDVFVCGGQNEIDPPFQVYLGSQSDRLEDMTAILDTNSWTWRIPISSYTKQPYPQSHAVISIINDTKVAFGFGINYHTVYDHFRIFDTVIESWESSPFQQSTSGGGNIFIDGSGAVSSKISSTIVWITMGCIVSAIILSYAVAIWTYGFKRLHLMILNSLKLVKREVWKPRVGEPGWAEASRLALKILFLLIFVYLISILTHQVINSPIIDQLSYESNAQMTVDVPDIKFCFSSWIEKKMPYIRCATDFGAQCSNFIIQLPTQIEPEGSTNDICLLFRAPSSFKLGQTSGRLESNGSFLKFDYYYDSGSSMNVTMKNGQVQVDVYNKLHDPNVAIYQINTTSGISTTAELGTVFEWNDIYEEDTYRSAENSKSRGINYRNSYHVNFGKISTITFELIKRMSLNPGVWNYFGIASSVKTRYEIETTETPEFFSTTYDPSSGAPQPLGSIHVVPLNCQTKVLREQKAFAFINAMGIFGGLFGLLFSLQSCLFGYRPRSPWGYMHRWSFGHLRSSLMRGLKVNFFPNASANNDIAYQQQQQQHQHIQKYMMSTATTKPEEEEGCDAPGISMNTNKTIATAIHPLSANTTKIISTPSYLLPTSPTVAFPINGSPKDEKEIRMALIEDRIHMLERLFQAYYIDDEIFRSLDHALKNDVASSASSSSNSVLEGGRKRK